MKRFFEVVPHAAKALSWWFGEEVNIKLDPPYQRESGIWTRTDQAYLIDSILNDFDLPKFYIADFRYSSNELNTTDQPYAVIDGKQRFEAIFAFFRSQLPLDRRFKLLNKPDLKLGGLFYKDLQAKYPELARKFDNYGVTVMSVLTNEPEKINELFVRLNRSKPLTGAEVRSAVLSSGGDTVRALAGHHFFGENISFSTKRKQNHNVAAKVLVLESKGGAGSTKKQDMDAFVRGGLVDEKVAEQAFIEAQLNLNTMQSIFGRKDPLLKSAGIVPLYYLFVRRLELEVLPHVRQFLVEFESAREDNRRRSSAEDPHVDQSLLSFEIANRSPDDAASYSRRVQVLQSRFAEFLGRHA